MGSISVVQTGFVLLGLLSWFEAYMEEAELPLVKVAKETSNPAEVCVAHLAHA